MTDEQQPTSWRERFFGTRSNDTAPAQAGEEPRAAEESPAAEERASADADDARIRPADDTDVSASQSAEAAADDAEVASMGADEHDRSQPLVEHERDLDEPVGGLTNEPVVEPRVIAPSALRGPSHSAAHPDDLERSAAETSSLEQQPDDEPEAPGAAGADAASHGEAAADADRGGATAMGATTAGATTAGATAAGATAAGVAAAGSSGAEEPPPLVEPQRPSFGLRRSDATETARLDALDDDGDQRAVVDDGRVVEGDGRAVLGDGTRVDEPTMAHDTVGEQRTVDLRSDDPEATQAMPASAIAGATAATAVGAAAHRREGEPDFVDGAEPARTEVLDTHDEAETRRFGIVRDADATETTRASTIPVDDETARAAATGTPIVLVEEPVPPRRKGARAVGFAVAILATIVFAALFAASFFVDYLFDRQFNADETLRTLWLRPAYLLPVIVFFVAYWLLTLIVNRAGWWAHVLGGFIVAVLVYLAHIAGRLMEDDGGWNGIVDLPGTTASELAPLVLAPISVLAFVLAREVPIWVGGIVARRGRKAREWNRQAMEDFNAENAERLAAYERARA